MTNNALAEHGGSECFVRDVARHMAKSGHRVTAYSTALGAVADEIRGYGCVVIDDLSLLTDEPDIIHAQHHYDATSAMLRFPRVPAIHITHGVLPWEEAAPPALQCIRRYLCISEGTRQALIASHPKVADRVEVIPNFACADVFRFRRDQATASTRSSLKALIYGNYKPRDLTAIREACEEVGAFLDEIGAWSSMGNQPNPQDFLPQYDLVFAYGKSAIEALFVDAMWC
jgi:hypothetical protein